MPADQVQLRVVQRLGTSGARAAAAFQIHGAQFLAIPQLAQDVPGGPLGMNMGDSDVPLLLYKADGDSGQFNLFQELPVPGGEDAEFFTICDRSFLATASIRSGTAPYNTKIASTIFEWDGTSFVEFQRVPSFAAKQWRHFSLSGRHFLALAQGVDIPGIVPTIPADSTIYEWDGSSFQPFQTVPSKWGYNWLHFTLDGKDFLAYADHVAPSILMVWSGTEFVHYQTFDGIHGRAFCFFKDKAGFAYLTFARISSSSLLHRWNGERFEIHQHLEGQGGREFTLLANGPEIYVFQARFITGSPKNPNPVLESAVYRLENGQLKVVTTFPTQGGTDLTTISRHDEIYLVVAERPPPQKNTMSAPFQVPEFVELFTSYTASSTSIGSELTKTVVEASSSLPLLVATSFDMLFYPSSGKDPSYINFRLGSRGFRELAAISHLGPALGSLIQMRQNGTTPDSWQPHARNLLAKIHGVQKKNSEKLWRDGVQVEAFRGRESAIAAMVDYACKLTARYLALVLDDIEKLTPEFLRDNYLEASDNQLEATVPFNAVMIATFFLVGLDISHRMQKWLRIHNVDWQHAMVLITGRQGRETSGVTISTNSVAQVILQSSDLQLPLKRLYIAPHGAVPAVDAQSTTEELRQHEKGFRSLWSSLTGIGQLGETMFADYPAYEPAQTLRPVIDSSTRAVSELPKILGPDDWFSMNTRMRVVVEDARQLLSGCVTDYAAEQLRVCGGDVSRVTVPGLDGVDYRGKASLAGYCTAPKTFTISSYPFPLQVDLPSPIQTFDAGNGLLAYRQSGPSNCKPIIWVHGLPLDSRSWTAQYNHFIKSFRNVFPDLRGYGSSSKLPSTVTDVTQLYCDDLLALMKHLHIQEATIVGFASAGHVALRFAAHNPDRVRSLVLLNASPRFKRNDTDYQFGFSDAQIQDHFLSAADRGIEALADVILDPDLVFRDLSRSDATKVGSWFRTMCYNAGVQTLRGFFDHIVNDDDRAIVPLVKAPTLLLASSLGQEVPSQAAIFLRQKLQNATLMEIPGADHFLNVTRPAVVNDLISGFLAGIYGGETA